MRFSMFYIFSVLGIVGLSGAAGAAEGYITKYPNGEIKPYGYARGISVNAQYNTWGCDKAGEVQGTLVADKAGTNRATCQWECPVGYCWSNSAACNTDANERGRTIYRTFVVDPNKTDGEFSKIVADGDADEDGQLDYGTDIHKKAYVTWTYGTIMAFGDSLGAGTAACIPNYAYNYFVCSYIDAKPSVKSSSLAVDKVAGKGTCTFTCEDGYKKNGAATYTMTASEGAYGAQVVINATPCTGNAITVDYDESGGSTVDNGSCTYGGSLTLPAAPKRTGYTFVEWKLSNGIKKPAGTPVDCDNKSLGVYEGKSSGNVVAQWTPITYTIEYNGNGATSGTMAASTYTYDVSKKLTANAFKRTGYTFAGWNTKADGTGTKYTNQQEIKNLYSNNGAKLTLYAQWGGETYTITYDCDDGYYGATGTSTTGTDTATFGGAYTIPLEAYCRHSTKPFGGWNFPNQ